MYIRDVGGKTPGNGRQGGGSVKEGVRSHLAVKGWSHIIVFMAGATKKGFRKSQARATHVCVIGLGGMECE